MKQTTKQAWLAMLKQRCPRCGRGPLFRSLFTMYEDCSVCELHFEKEPGYFIGSLYISYGMASLLLIFFMFLAWLSFPTWDPGWYVLLAGAVYLPLVPLVFRYSRVIWMYFDNWAWPTKDSAA